MESTNYYEDKANRQFLNETNKISKRKFEQPEEKPEKWKDTAKGVGTDLLVGVLGGGLAAATIGKPAFLVGLVISGYGHYTENKVISALGLGMMASGTMTAFNGKTQAPNLPDRLKEFQEELKRKLFLDKLFPATKKDSVNGVEQILEKQRTPIKKSATSDFLSNDEIEKPTINNSPSSELNGTVEKKKNPFTNNHFDDWRTNGRIY